MTERDVDTAAELLELTPAQGRAAHDLYAAYAADLRAVQTAAEHRVSEARREYEASGDSKVLISPEVRQALESSRQKAIAVARQFLVDLRALTTAEQAGNWVRVERLIRRREALPDGKLCGEDLDLRALLEELRPTISKQDDVRNSLDKYESELDQALAKRAATRATLSERLDRLSHDSKDDETAAVLAEFRKAGVGVRDVNDRYAAVLGTILTGEVGTEFRKRYDERKFPRIYAEPYALSSLKRAAAFKDLGTEASSRIDDARGQYVRQLAMLNAKWAQAVSRVEADGGGSPFWRLGLDPTSPTSADEREMVQAGEARRDLDRTTLATLRSLLTEDQRNRLVSDAP